ncbi:MAG: SNF2-related protein [Sporolactobacillus sp.]
MTKNFNTKTAKFVRWIKARNRFALSSTPIENSINELWSIFQTILPGFFPRLTDFKKLTNEKLAQMIRPFLLRRLKKDVLAELPDKIETVQTSELTQGQKAIYMAYLRRIQQETREALAKDGFEKSHIKILTGLTRLCQICCHPAVEDHAVGRAHRIGQRHVVQVVRLITEGTIEEKIYDLQQKKRDLIETVVESGDQALARLSEEDIKAILRL